MKLEGGLFWPIPITLSAERELAQSIGIGEEVALCDGETGEDLALLTVAEIYEIDKALECAQVYRTADPAHPGVQKVLQQGEVNLAGPVRCLSEGHYPESYRGLYHSPAETRALFRARGWSTVAAFQTRNPMHRSHEYLAKIAIETMDGVLIHSLLGALKPGDIPAEVRSEAIGVLVKNYFAPNTVIQAGYPLDMRYAGPREALLHALFRQNYGCSHLIVGRDHAGVGDYYGAFDAQDVFDGVPPGALEIEIFRADHTAFSKKLGRVVMMKDAPDHGPDDFVMLSGTKVREKLAAGEPLPEEFARPEVAAILMEHYRAEA
jgi:sulfate adenylyltransferase